MGLKTCAPDAEASGEEQPAVMDETLCQYHYIAGATWCGLPREAAVHQPDFITGHPFTRYPAYSPAAPADGSTDARAVVGTITHAISMIDHRAYNVARAALLALLDELRGEEYPPCRKCGSEIDGLCGDCRDEALKVDGCG
jgi:hypothetical protein